MSIKVASFILIFYMFFTFIFKEVVGYLTQVFFNHIVIAQDYYICASLMKMQLRNIFLPPLGIDPGTLRIEFEHSTS